MQKDKRTKDRQTCRGRERAGEEERERERERRRGREGERADRQAGTKPDSEKSAM